MENFAEGEEYAVDTYPKRTHIDTVLAHGTRHAVVEALVENPNPDQGNYSLFVVHHMPSGNEEIIKLTKELRNRIHEKQKKKQ